MDTRTSAARKYYLYAIRLRDDVLDKTAFREANPGYREPKPCYYIGTSRYRPKKRFKKHLQGEKSSKWLRQFGLYVAQSKCRVMWEIEHGDRAVQERRHAEALRGQGYGIWQN